MSSPIRKRRFSRPRPSKQEDHVDPEKMAQLAHRKVVELDLLPLYESMKVPVNCRRSKDTMDFTPSSLSRVRLEMTPQKPKRKRFFTDIRQSKKEEIPDFLQDRAHGKVEKTPIENENGSGEKINGLNQKSVMNSSVPVMETPLIKEDVLKDLVPASGTTPNNPDVIPFVRDHQEDRMMLCNNPTRIWKRRLSNNAERHAREVLEKRQMYH